MLAQTEKTGVSNPFKFAGGYLDASGYYLFGVRYYDPSLGRWTQQDPVAGILFDLNSGNRYTYVEDNPVNQVDPSGKSCSSSQILILAVVFVASLGALLGVLLAIPASALASLAAFAAFASTQAGLSVIVTAASGIIGTQASALGLSGCV